MPLLTSKDYGSVAASGCATRTGVHNKTARWEAFYRASLRNALAGVEAEMSTYCIFTLYRLYHACHITSITLMSLDVSCATKLFLNIKTGLHIITSYH